MTARRYRWGFDFDKHTEGWQMSNSDYIFPVEDGSIRVDHPGSNRRIQLGGLNIQASPDDVIVIRIRNATPQNNARLFWRRTGDAGFDNTRLLVRNVTPNSGVFQELTFEVGGQANWTGTIEELRFLPANNATTGFSLVDHIELNPPAESTGVFDWMTLGRGE
jgi:hypothetical protein